ncbi:TetR/AcrR family transcriptional regulator [Microbacterium marinilacus]|uniref:TetR/AcrR family transcriptional regulator n=1 Tax=Microbacterium marinilacus TaxID=415209 RepID=A0ABP7BJG7_9MICO|nr:TetR/AcrR family transcriptional regulator [Microbacterium marinilacus]MBY0689514.1 TetR/AcrR family transcriptional regulator [Microbacterium marinilacus]
MNDVVIDWTPKARAVLAAADELFYARGIHAVGVDAIAERAGVTKKTLYDRFGSKERLVVEYLAARDREWRDFLAARLGPAGDDPRARLVAVFDASAAWAADRSGKGCSMINAHAEISDPAHPAYAVIVGQKRWMRELFAGIVADTSLRGVPRAQEVTDAVLLLHEGALVADGMGIVERPFERARETALGLLAG